MCRVNGYIGRNSDFIGILIEPCSPPSKSARCNYIMFAIGHKLHISPTVCSFIPIHKLNMIFFEIKSYLFFVGFCPLNTSWITKHEKNGITNILSNIVRGTAEIAIVITFVIIHVSFSCMKGDRIRIFNLV